MSTFSRTGPQVGSVADWGFSTGGSGQARSLAELGFIVIQLDHMGTLKRSKAFHDFYYGNMGDNGIPDHIAAIRQLAAQHDYIDIDKVGIYGFSGGGFASTDAILRYPDFFKVAVSGSGNHDNRTYGFFWGEKYQGLFKADSAKGTDNFESAANYTLAKNLKGKLLLTHGDMDNNVHTSNTLRVVDALIKANKDFDMHIFPDTPHMLPAYGVRRTEGLGLFRAQPGGRGTAGGIRDDRGADACGCARARRGSGRFRSVAVGVLQRESVLRRLQLRWRYSIQSAPSAYM